MYVVDQVFQGGFFGTYRPSRLQVFSPTSQFLGKWSLGYGRSFETVLASTETPYAVEIYDRGGRYGGFLRLYQVSPP